MRYTAFYFNVRGLSIKLCGTAATVLGLNFFYTNTRTDLLKRNCNANLEETHKELM